MDVQIRNESNSENMNKESLFYKLAEENINPDDNFKNNNKTNLINNPEEKINKVWDIIIILIKMFNYD